MAVDVTRWSPGAGEPAEAEAHLREILDARRKLLVDDHPDTRVTRQALDALG